MDTQNNFKDLYNLSEEIATSISVIKDILVLVEEIIIYDPKNATGKIQSLLMSQAPYMEKTEAMCSDLVKSLYSLANQNK
ncbi:hypothetical protein [Gallibacterium anatis]|uniref:Uncharacterized protein n=1 Tax=Gallibacterium anatis 12656/12 TaxID=1195244 RepID=U1GMA8_9PAST|nr:hypothetical protein [Gallibacterium anatis]ERF78767.1 hypothetical protein N561_04600 [Gallibacterium anatis 12656/12]KGQ51344.1 hypothetical protein JL04_01525 [Gallibacterium anatis]